MHGGLRIKKKGPPLFPKPGDIGTWFQRLVGRLQLQLPKAKEESQSVHHRGKPTSRVFVVPGTCHYNPGNETTLGAFSVGFSTRGLEQLKLTKVTAWAPFLEVERHKAVGSGFEGRHFGAVALEWVKGVPMEEWTLDCGGMAGSSKKPIPPRCAPPPFA
eukprot:2585914-Amphidinium_carterae.1